MYKSVSYPKEGSHVANSHDIKLLKVRSSFKCILFGVHFDYDLNSKTLKISDIEGDKYCETDVVPGSLFSFIIHDYRISNFERMPNSMVVPGEESFEIFGLM